MESDEDDILFLDGADARPEVRDDFAEPLYGLIGEVSGGLRGGEDSVLCSPRFFAINAACGCSHLT